MDLSKQNILFFPRTMGQGGTENVVLQLCEIFKPYVNKIVVCSSGGIHEKELKEMGIRHYKLPDISDKNPMVMAKIIQLLRKIINKEHITVIHSHHRMAAFYSEIVAPKDVIKIADAHNTFQDKRGLTKFAYRNTNLIAVGKMVKKNLTEYFGLPDKQITVIHNAVKPFDEKITSIKLLNDFRNEGYALIGNIGRLSEQKGMSYFIRAAKIVHNAFPKTKFIIVGEGDEKEQLKTLAKKQNIENDIVFLGYRDDIQNVISQLDFVVLSSLWEGLPLTPIEAFSVGKTVIGTAVDGTPEIIQDDKNGYLVPAKDVKALADKMIYLLKNPDKRRCLEKNAKKRYEEEFSFEHLKEQYLKYYEEL